MTRRCEVWGGGAVAVDRIVEVARSYEASGFDGFFVVDSQALTGDPWVALGAAATVTDRIGLAVAVTNPYTRHAAVTANAVASLQRLSNGRAVLGVGRGDSSLVELGLAPAPLSAFRAYVSRVASYLRGEAVALDDPPPGWRRSPDAHDSLNRIGWLDEHDRRVPLDVTATGPRVIALGALVADRVTFAVGAEPARLEWALACARAAAGSDAPVDVGAWIPVAPHPDIDVSRQLVAGSVAATTRLATLDGTPVGPADRETAAEMVAVRGAYNMQHHARAGTEQTHRLTPEYIDRSAVTGTAERCVDRLRAIGALGIRRIYISRGWGGVAPEDVALSRRLFVDEVLPHL